MHWKSCIRAAQASKEVILPRADRTFRRIASVHMRGDQLEFYLIRVIEVF